MPSSGCKTCADRKSTRLNSSHLVISYAVFCLKKKNKTHRNMQMHRCTKRWSLRLSRGAVAVVVGLVGSCQVRFVSWGVVVFFLLFFFLNNRAPPEISPFPLPAPLPI